MNWKSLHSIYFLGIGGIGMSALARWFKHLGVPVYGYDKTPTTLTHQLQAEGIKINFEDDEAAIPEEVKASKSDKLVIWTPAIPKDSIQLHFFRAADYLMKKRSEVLGMITSQMTTVAVAGTHGKTTTSSMIAHLLKHAGRNTTAFLGGVTQNYETNMILHQESKSDAPIVVVEADEFDRSFLELHPNVAVVTSLDADHLDIYEKVEEMTKSYEKFLSQTHKKGQAFIQNNAMTKLNRSQFEDLATLEYGLTQGSIHAANIQAGVVSFKFDYISQKAELKNMELKVPGFHNVENALAAIAVALHFGLKPEEIRAGLETYQGVKRRFEIRYKDADLVYIDDYAHHPEEIRAFLSSVKAMYPTKKLTVIFQPHLYSRTRDLAPEFSESLSIADEVILMEIYPARELPIEGVNSAMLLEGMSCREKQVMEDGLILDHLKKSKLEVLVTLGAGDIDRMVEPITNWIKDDRI